VADYVLEPTGPSEIRDRIRTAGSKVVLAEELPEDEVAAAVKQAGAQLVILSTMEEGWGEGEELAPEGYFEAMKENLSKLHAALKTP